MIKTVSRMCGIALLSCLLSTSAFAQAGAAGGGGGGGGGGEGGNGGSDNGGIYGVLQKDRSAAQAKAKAREKAAMARVAPSGAKPARAKASRVAGPGGGPPPLAGGGGGGMRGRSSDCSDLEDQLGVVAGGPSRCFDTW